VIADVHSETRYVINYILAVSLFSSIAFLSLPIHPFDSSRHVIKLYSLVDMVLTDAFLKENWSGICQIFCAKPSHFLVTHSSEG
jgi:hypothetical protein